ncbi:hypothetical protein C2W64_01187 [Brevibacillus laterosporus]|nr:hypothetical protein C2W64_01187 [Brevibacillus laterosporus]
MEITHNRINKRISMKVRPSIFSYFRLHIQYETMRRWRKCLVAVVAVVAVAVAIASVDAVAVAVSSVDAVVSSSSDRINPIPSGFRILDGIIFSSLSHPKRPRHFHVNISAHWLPPCLFFSILFQALYLSISSILQSKTLCGNVGMLEASFFLWIGVPDPEMPACVVCNLQSVYVVPEGSAPGLSVALVL